MSLQASIPEIEASIFLALEFPTLSLVSARLSRCLADFLPYLRYPLVTNVTGRGGCANLAHPAHAGTTSRVAIPGGQPVVVGVPLSDMKQNT